MRATGPAAARRRDWPLEWLRRRLGYEPRDPALFVAALTHRSARGGQSGDHGGDQSEDNNERLEFLGDSVLNLVIAERLFTEFPQADEGSLSRLRSRLVSAEPLAATAASVGLGEMLVLGAGEMKTGGHRRESIQADALEALIGAVYLDGGMDAARTLVVRLFEQRMAELPDAETLKDPKTRLQELLQAQGHGLPAYATDRIDGEPHAQTFLVTCRLESPPLSAQGAGSSRRRAEQVAAQGILHQLGQGEPRTEDTADGS